NEAGITLSPQHIFEYQTVAGIVQAASRTRASDAVQGPISGPVPLSPVQRRFFARELHAPNRYCLAVLLDCAEPLSAAIAERCAGALLSHHDALRMRYRNSNGTWEQWCPPAVEESPFSRHDLSGVAECDREKAVERISVALQDRCSLESGPLFHVALLEYATGA